jgi:prepilin-type processing-associated H-X9-DG protein
MPFILHCVCGWKLRAPEKYAGKRVRCPNCGAAVRVPTVLPDEPVQLSTEDEFDEAEAGGGADQPQVLDDLMPSEETPTALPGGKPKPFTCDPVFAEAASRAARQRDDAARGPTPWFNIMGVEFTTTKIITALLLIGVIVGVTLWYFTGPGALVHIHAARTVRVTPLLQGLNTRAPYNLFTGIGDRSLGLQGVQSKSNPNPLIAQDKFVFSMGGGDSLNLVSPDPNGDHLLIDVGIAPGLFDFENQKSRYDVVFNADAFVLRNPDGSDTGMKPRLIFSDFASGSTIDLSGAETSDYHCLLPVVGKPFQEGFELFENQPASGTLIYDGSEGVTGHFNFVSFYHRSGGTPGITGLSADGQLQQRIPGGAHITYDYRGGELVMAWTGDPHALGLWGKGRWTTVENFSPYDKHEVKVLVPMPAGAAGPWVLTFGKTELCRVTRARAVAAAAKAVQAPPPPASPASPAAPAAPTGAVALTPSSPSPGPGLTPATPPIPMPAQPAAPAQPGAVAPQPPAPQPPPQPPPSAMGSGNASGPPGGGGASGGVSVTGYFEALAAARKKARGVVAMSNLQQFGLAFEMYHQSYAGAWPESLEQLKRVMPEVDALLVNPRTKAAVGFAYQKPGNTVQDVADPAHTPVMWELDAQGNTDPHGSVLYADGHVEQGQ